MLQTVECYENNAYYFCFFVAFAFDYCVFLNFCISFFDATISGE